MFGESVEEAVSPLETRHPTTEIKSSETQVERDAPLGGAVRRHAHTRGNRVSRARSTTGIEYPGV